MAGRHALEVVVVDVEVESRVSSLSTARRKSLPSERNARRFTSLTYGNRSMESPP
jgi:hypothetical protein